MTSNFIFLQYSQDQDLQTLFQDAQKAENNLFLDPRTSAFYARFLMENLVSYMYKYDHELSFPYDRKIANLLQQSEFKELIPHHFSQQLDIIRANGNNAVHKKQKVSIATAEASLKYLHQFAYWVVNTYTESEPIFIAFNTSILPKKQTEENTQLSPKALKDLEAKLKQETEKRHSQEQEIQLLKKQLAEKEQEITQIRTRNEQKPIQVLAPPFTEAETRKHYIDALLTESGWDIEGEDVALEFEVEGMPKSVNPSGKGFVDYVLFDEQGKPLAVVEAKRASKDLKIGKTQAKRYADCLEKMTGQRPFIFYTNGYEIAFWDDLNYPNARNIQGFYKQTELQRLLWRRSNKKDLADFQIPPEIGGSGKHIYQQIAGKHVLDTFGVQNRRTALLIMATGTGKTRTSIGIVDMLMRAGWIQNILFLADRTSLVKQAKKNFNKLLPHCTSVEISEDSKQDPTTDARLTFSTYPAMMNRIDSSVNDGLRHFGVGHFDLIIVDEAHRSVYKKYKAIFNYFDALMLGLTATPKDDVDKNTYKIFNIDGGNPTYAYELDEAIADGVLNPFKAINVPTKFNREGIKYDELSEEDKAKYEEELTDELTGELLTDEIESKALDKWLFNKGTTNIMLKYLMENGIKVEGGDKIGKTIIFAKNQKHAEFIESCFYELYNNKDKDEFLKVITHQDRLAQDSINKFEEQDLHPQIAVSVDMLDTGIDVPSIVNLVMAKPIKSKIKFWQMIGRGTRLCEDLFGYGKDKEEFYIFDFCQNFEFFKNIPEGFTPKTQESISQQIFKKRLQLADILKEIPYAEDEDCTAVQKEILDTLHTQVLALNKDSFINRPYLKYFEAFYDRIAWDNLDNENLHQLAEFVSPLIAPEKELEIRRRFDLQMLSFQLSIIEASSAQQRYIELVQHTATRLLTKRNLPAIKTKVDLLQSILAPQFTANLSIPTIEYIRKEVGALLQFLEKEKANYKIYETDLADELQETEQVYITTNPNELTAYKLRMKAFLEENKTHITIHKLRTNQRITSEELSVLESMLFDEGTIGTKEQYQVAYGDQPLGLFIRQMLKMDFESAQNAFSDFYTAGNLNVKQSNMLALIIKHFVSHGSMNPDNLTELPFTNYHEEGVYGIFGEEGGGKIFSIVENMNENAGIA